MITKDLFRLNMFRTVKEVCSQNIGIVSTNAAFEAAYGLFSLKVDEIIKTAKAQGKVITGITTDKNVDKDEVVQAATDMAGLVFAYASGVKNNTLKESVDFSYSDIDRLKGDLLVTRASDIYDIATENLALLGNTVTVSSLEAYQVKITKYSNSLPGPRIATSEKGTHTGNVEVMVREASTILKEQMDKFSVNFKEKNPEFLALYINARNIMEVGTSAKKLPPPPNDGTA